MSKKGYEKRSSGGTWEEEVVGLGMRVCIRGLHHRKQALHPAVECDPLALDQMLLGAEYHEASVLRTTHCSALHGLPA